MARLLAALATFMVFTAAAAGSSLAADVCSQKSFQSRPIPMGVSGGNITAIDSSFCCSGTLGALVQNSTGTRRFILSNNHVIGRNNKAPIGSGIVQPGLIDNACLRDRGDAVAKLSGFIPINFTGASNMVDAAVAVTNSSLSSADILNIGAISANVATAQLDMSVQKMGRTSCRTFGTVSAVNVTINVSYQSICRTRGGTARFIGQIQISDVGDPFATSGDSGSLVVTDETCPRAVGLLFAGGNGATFANPISTVLSRLSKKMVGGCTVTTGAPEPLTDDDALIAAGGGSAGESVASERAAVNAASAVKARHDDELMAIPGVVGTGIGRSAKTGQIAIKVYLEKDLATARSATPTEIDGVPVEVEVTGPIVAY